MTLRVGVLICDDLHVGLETGRSDDLGLFRELLGPGFQAEGWRLHDGDRPPAAEYCDAWLVGGSRASVFDDQPWIARAARQVRAIAASDRPLVGMCFGHQLVHHSLGGMAVRSERGWGIGCYPVAVHAADGLDIGDTIRLPAVHRDQVLRPAPGFRRLAGSEFCPNYLTRRGRILTVQGHPEFDRAFYDAVLDRVSARVDADIMTRARATLPVSGDLERFRGVLRRFIRDGRGGAASPSS